MDPMLTVPADVAGRIACGVAGWSYPDWKGYVYGPEVKDELRFVAGFVDMIEINSTFYRPPEARTAESWVRRTADLPGFFFAAKLHQDLTHRGLVEPFMVEAVRRGFEPLRREGRLRHLLAQFRYDFADTPAAREHLGRIGGAFGGLANLVFELRHGSWQSPGALEFLRSLGVAVANLDCPVGRQSFTLRVSGVGEHAYLRLHGRNAKAWFSKGAGRDETYNYQYSPKEVDEIVRRAVEIAAMTRSLTLVANNHYQGKEAVNVLQIKARLTGSKVAVPPLLAQKYPELGEIAGVP
jgi:uncharacterized protein YecE (DUF72 family)